MKLGRYDGACYTEYNSTTYVIILSIIIGWDEYFVHLTKDNIWETLATPITWNAGIFISTRMFTTWQSIIYMSTWLKNIIRGSCRTLIWLMLYFDSTNYQYFKSKMVLNWRTEITYSSRRYRVGVAQKDVCIPWSGSSNMLCQPSWIHMLDCLSSSGSSFAWWSAWG